MYTKAIRRRLSGKRLPNFSFFVRKKSSHIKNRQHVNPLSRTYYNLEIDANKELEFFEQHDRMDKPFHIDIGSHNGFYLFGLATLFPNTNFIGLEIQNRQVEKCLKKRQRLKIEPQKTTVINVRVLTDGQL